MLYDMIDILKNPLFYYSVFSAILGFLFFLRGIKKLQAKIFYRYIFPVLAIFIAIVLFPVTFSLFVARVIAGLLLFLLAAALLADIIFEIFIRFKNEIAPFAYNRRPPAYLAEIYKALEIMAMQGTGALIVIERKNKLDDYIGGGIPFDSDIRAEILLAFFSKVSPVHDGGIIVRNGRIARLKSILPLSVSPEASSKFGTRHHAAAGITEKTDAIVFVVSEERGEISVAYRGLLTKVKSRTEIANTVKSILRKR